jgi:hypothetical protein
MARSRFAFVMVGSVLAACSGKDPYNPGEPLGTFHVTAALTQSSCGPVPNPWTFDVRLAHEGTTLYWIQGGAPISGIVDGASKVTLRTSEQHELRPANERLRLPACLVVREDELDVALAAEGEAALTDLGDARRLAGKLVYRFTPTSESDCTDQTSALGGDFAALPCEVAYDVTATSAGTQTGTKKANGAER